MAFIMTGSSGEQFRQLQDLGVQVAFLKSNSLKNLVDRTMITGRILGDDAYQRALKYKAYFEKNVARVSKVVAQIPEDKRVRVYHSVGMSLTIGGLRRIRRFHAISPGGRLALLALLPVSLFFLSFLLGRYPIPLADVMGVLLHRVIPMEQTWSATMESVIWEVRLPRIILALIIGAGLSISGTAFQGMFRNPLVSPDILGVSAAAGFGAALAILISNDPILIQALALAFGILGVLVTYGLSRVHNGTPVIMLVLAGVVVASLFSALISITKYVADPQNQLPAITFWLMGSLNAARWSRLATVFPAIFVGTVGLLLVSWRINLLAMGDEEARSLGVRTEHLKTIIIACATLVTAASVSACGIVGWVGLVIPHIGRMIVGPDHRVLLPASVLLGSAFMLLIDDIARSATAAEIPLGILTAIVGTPFFAFLMRRTKGGWR